MMDYQPTYTESQEREIRRIREALHRAACEEGAAVRFPSLLEVTSEAECGLCGMIHIPWRDVPDVTVERIIAAAEVDKEQAREQMRAMDRHWRRS